MAEWRARAVNGSHGGGVSRENITDFFHFNMIFFQRLNILQH